MLVLCAEPKCATILCFQVTIQHNSNSQAPGDFVLSNYKSLCSSIYSWEKPFQSKK